MDLLSTDKKNAVLGTVKSQLSARRAEIIEANAKDLNAWSGTDQAMYDRLVVNDKKIDGMIQAIDHIIADADPVGCEIYKHEHPNGMMITNMTAPFGTVMIIYESRPDVTIEAAMVAFKSNNKILLKGGKEAVFSNRVLVDCWQVALKVHGLSKDWVTLLELQREETQAFLKNPDRPLDLIVPRGGEGLIAFVKKYATCPVLISGRGNNFLYAHEDAPWDMTTEVIMNAKTDKISACNALDKVLVHRNLPDIQERLESLVALLQDSGVEVLLDQDIVSTLNNDSLKASDLSQEWSEEYLAMKIAIGMIEGPSEAISLINEHSGGHSVIIMTEDLNEAQSFMDSIDAAAVYHNASSRFTDGGQFGLGAELAISTDKLHHRGPLGLQQLVTNKWYVFGNGQIRK